MICSFPACHCYTSLTHFRLDRKDPVTRWHLFWLVEKGRKARAFANLIRLPWKQVQPVLKRKFSFLYFAETNFFFFRENCLRNAPKITEYFAETFTFRENSGDIGEQLLFYRRPSVQVFTLKKAVQCTPRWRYLHGFPCCQSITGSYAIHVIKCRHLRLAETN